MNKFILILLFTIATSKLADFELKAKFSEFMKEYKKEYPNSEEYEKRMKIFADNLELLKSKNYKYKAGITKFMDLTPEEFSEKYLLPPYTPSNNKKVFERKTILKDVPETWDWVDEGAVAPVINQPPDLQSPSIAAVGPFTTQYYKGFQVLERFSAYQVEECTTYPLDFDLTYAWIQDNGGLGFWKDYDHAYGECNQDKTKNKVDISAYAVMKGDEDEIKEEIYNNSPLPALMNGDNLQFYQGGILDLDGSECNPSKLNHAILIVGYGSESGLYYWVCQNTWGSDWGESGYFRISRGKGTCGINRFVTSVNTFPLI